MTTLDGAANLSCFGKRSSTDKTESDCCYQGVLSLFGHIGYLKGMELVVFPNLLFGNGVDLSHGQCQSPNHKRRKHARQSENPVFYGIKNIPGFY